MVSLAGVVGVLRGIPLQHHRSHQVLALLINEGLALQIPLRFHEVPSRIGIHVTPRSWRYAGLGTLSWVSHCLLSAPVQQRRPSRGKLSPFSNVSVMLD